MPATKNTLKHSLLAFFILSFFFIGLAPRAYAYEGILDLNVTEIPNTIFAGVSGVANPVTAGMTTAEKIKNFIIDPVARVALKMIIKKLTAQTVNWINSGFQGSPGFVQDPGQFFLGVGDQVASQYLSNTTFNQLCTPFQAQVRLALVKNYLQDQNNYSCTLDKIKDNYEAFANDFTQGGWQGWFEMTQTSGGNPYDAYFAAQTSLSQKVSTQVNKYQQQLQEGGGFLSFEKCKPGKALTQEDIDKYDYDNGDGAAEADGFFVGYCSKDNMETVTPGSVISSQLNKALGTDLSQLELAKSVDEIATALITALFSRVMGNTGLAQGTSGAIPEVIVPDNNKPMITLLAKSPMTIQVMSQAQGQDGTVVGTSGTFSDPGAFAYDTKDGDISDRIIATGNVDVNTPGTYTVTYNVTNSKGVKADPVQLEVDVIQGSGGGGTIPPVTCVTDPVTGVMTCTVPNPEPNPGPSPLPDPTVSCSLPTVLSAALPKVAFDPINQIYLVVGLNGNTDGAPDGMFFDKNGHKIGEKFIIATENADYTGWADVTFGGPDNDPVFLVTYITTSANSTNPKYGRLVRYQNGTALVGERSKILDVGGEWFGSEHAQSVWDGQEFVVSNRVGSGGTFGYPVPIVHHFNIDGTVSEGHTLADPDVDYFGSPAVACSPNGVCLLVGYTIGGPDGSRGGTYGVLFDAHTLNRTRDYFYMDNNTPRNQNQSVIYSTKTGKFLTTWWRSNYVDSRTVDTDGTMGPLNLNSFGPGAGDLVLKYNPSTESTMLLTKGAGSTLYAILLSDDGLPIISSKRLIVPWDGQVQAWWPSAATNNTNGDYLILWNYHDGYHLSLVKISSSGTRIECSNQ